METTFLALKQKDVINLNDGKHLGKVCDVTMDFPKADVLGFTVTGCKGFRFSKQEIFLPVSCVVKIGEDAILVKFGKEPDRPDCKPNAKPDCKPDPCGGFNGGFSPNGGRRSYDEYE